MSWADAIAAFTDQTGRRGPATWEAGTYPQGQAEHPVGGVSWYEAAAYAAFRGKSLPTIYHWTRASGTQLAAYITPLSNFRATDWFRFERPARSAPSACTTWPAM